MLGCPRDREGDVTLANTATQFSDASEVAARVRKLWISATEGGEQSVNDSFYNSGGTSIAGLRLISALRAEFGVRLSWRNLKSAKNADDLASQVVAAWSESAPGNAR